MVFSDAQAASRARVAERIFREGDGLIETTRRVVREGVRLWGALSPCHLPEASLRPSVVPDSRAHHGVAVPTEGPAKFQGLEPNSHRSSRGLTILILALGIASTSLSRAAQLPDISTATPAFTVIGVTITGADITQDKISIQLVPSTLSGTLNLQLLGANGNDTIVNVTRNGGNLTESFDTANRTAGEYTQVQAVWTVGNSSASAVFSYHIQILGVYRHSQYNTPTESACNATPTQSAYLTTSQCNFSASDTFRSQFVSQAVINGDGISISHGVLHYDTFCIGQAGAPADAQGRSFRPVSAPVAGCSGRQLTGGQTVAVAVNQLQQLPCGTRIFINTVGVKTVTDSCPACNDGNHIDDYTSNAACAPGTIPDLGNFMTVKLFQ